MNEVRIINFTWTKVFVFGVLWGFFEGFFGLLTKVILEMAK